MVREEIPLYPLSAPPLESPPPPNLAKMGTKTLSYPGGIFISFRPPPTFELTPGGFFCKKTPPGRTQKSAGFLPAIVKCA